MSSFLLFEKSTLFIGAANRKKIIRSVANSWPQLTNSVKPRIFNRLEWSGNGNKWQPN